MAAGDAHTTSSPAAQLCWPPPVRYFHIVGGRNPPLACLSAHFLVLPTALVLSAPWGSWTPPRRRPSPRQDGVGAHASTDLGRVRKPLRDEVVQCGDGNAPCSPDRDALQFSTHHELVQERSTKAQYARRLSHVQQFSACVHLSSFLFVSTRIPFCLTRPQRTCILRSVSYGYRGIV